MAECFITQRGGAGAGLNFKVVGGNIRPSSPTEVMIWVNTTNKITEWVFARTAPSVPSEGMVWFKLGPDSSVRFNALKKNAILISPTDAKQYVSGVWKDKEAESYINGKWKRWILYLYDNGNEFAGVTGGWKEQYNYSTYFAKGTFAKQQTSLKMQCYREQAIGTTAVNSIDLTPYSTLVAEYSMTSNGKNGRAFLRAVSGEKASESKDLGENLQITLDVSELTGKDTIYFGIANEGYFTTTAYLKKVYLI